MRRLARAVARLVTAMAGGLPVASTCFAQVQLPPVNLGQTTFEDGLATPGWFFDAFGVYSNADKLKDSHGDTVPGRNRVTADTVITDAIYVNDGKLFGAWPTFVVFLPWADVEVKLANGLSSRVSGVADLTLATGLQWPTMKLGDGVFGQRLMLVLTIPTGQYDSVRAVNIGNNVISFNPYYAFTCEQGRFEVSSRIHYLWNSTNHNPYIGLAVNSTQPGQAFHVNFAASYGLTKGLRAGFSGYWLQQLTDDKLNGVRIPASRERTLGLGGGVRYQAGRGTFLFLDGYSEAAVRNREQGYSVIFRVVKVMPSGAGG